MIDLPPLPAGLIIAAIGALLATVGWLWRLEVRLGTVEKEVANDITGRKAVSEMRGDIREVKTRLDGQDRVLLRLDDKIDKLMEARR